jgi:hypothetical protein
MILNGAHDPPNPLMIVNRHAQHVDLSGVRGQL